MSLVAVPSQIVQFAEFPLEISEIRRNAQWPAGDALHELRRGVLAAVLVDVFAEPVEQRREPSFGSISSRISGCAASFCPEGRADAMLPSVQPWNAP